MIIGGITARCHECGETHLLYVSEVPDEDEEFEAQCQCVAPEMSTHTIVTEDEDE